MSSRLTRALLKLYPRRIRSRYGDELLDLQDELRGQGNLSRTRLIRDTLAGAVLVRPVRERARLVITAILVIAGLATAGSIIAAAGTSSRTQTSSSAGTGGSTARECHALWLMLCRHRLVLLAGCLHAVHRSDVDPERRRI